MILYFLSNLRSIYTNPCGLGLLLVKRILENYNGGIIVENKIQGDFSKGSNFIILIPEAI